MSHKVYSGESFEYSTPPRVFGSETEYTINPVDLYSYSTTLLQDYIPEQYLINSLSEQCPYQTVFTRNGGKLYVDGEMLEYATPECESPQSVLAHERAGEIIVAESASMIGEQEGAPQSIFKRSGYADINIGGEQIFREECTGHHENYFTNRWMGTASPHHFSSNDYHHLSSFLATRSIWAGTGMVAMDGYSVQQKSSAIQYCQGKTRSTDVQGFKPPYLLRSNRLEIRTGDGNMSDWVVIQKFALTSLVLRLIEHGKFPHSLSLMNPYAASMAFSKNPSALIELETGKQMTAIDHQASIIDAAYEAFSRYDIPDYEEKAVYEFHELGQDFAKTNLSDGDVNAVADRLDWAAKFEYLKQRGYEKGKSLSFNDVHHDLKWEKIGDKSVARNWFKKYGRKAITTRAIDSALYVPPPTRASQRTRLLRSLSEEKAKIESIRWDLIMTDRLSIHMDDAFIT